MQATHKERTVTFNDEKHSYILDDGTELTSVTTFIHQFFPEFDSKGMSEKCAGKKDYVGMSAEQVEAAWELKKVKAAEKGKRVHTFIEKLLKGETSTITDALEAKASLAVSELLRQFEVVASEKLVFSPRYGLSGTVDAILKDRTTGQILIADWKSSKSIDKYNKFSKGFNPLENLHDSNYIHYSLQLNLYKLLLHNEEYLDCSNCKMQIVHLTDKKYEIHDVDDHESNIFLMLLTKGRL